MKKYVALVTAACLALCLCSCGNNAVNDEHNGNADNDGKIVVTMMYGTDLLPSFESLVESTYPDIDMQIEINAEATIDGESERRLRNGHGTDIVTTTMPAEYVKDFVLDLSAEPFAGKYESSMIQSAMIDGKTCFIPLPGQYYGYIYNKTFLEQNGWKVPESVSELIELMDKAAAANVGKGEDGALFGMNNAALVRSSYFIGTQIPDFLGLSDGVIWSRDLLENNASFSDKMQDCLDNDMKMVEKGYFSLSGLSDKGNELPIEQRMLDGTLLITYSDMHEFNRLCELGDKYEYEMLPFLSDKGNQSWIIAQPDAYLAINSELSKPENADKLDACLRIFDLLSTVEGQTAVINDTGAEHSYLAEEVPHSDRIPDGLTDCIDKGMIYNIRIPSKLFRYFGSKMASALNGEVDVKDALAQVDDYYINGNEEIEYDQTLVGVAAEDMLYENFNTRTGETAIGNFVADAMREVVGADFAFANGGSIRGSLYEGNIFGSDLDTICPYDNKLAILETDAATIRLMLENGISGMVQDSGIPAGRFLNVSGLCYSFKKPAEDGSTELLSVTLPDGSPLDENKKYTIVVTTYMAGEDGYLNNNGDGFTMLNVFSSDVPLSESVKLVSKTDYTYADALKHYVDMHNSEPISAKTEGRIKVVE